MKRTLIYVVSAIVAVVLVVLALVLLPIFLHKSAGSSGQVAPSGFVSQVSATGEDGRTRTLEAFTESGDVADLSELAPGDVFIVRGSGYDSAIGIYVGFCEIPEDPASRPSPCLGGIPEDAQQEKQDGIAEEALESAWVNENWAWKAFASHTFEDAEAGTFEVKLVVPPATGEGVDCTVDSCGLFTRADHTALSDRVQDIYLPIAFAGQN